MGNKPTNQPVKPLNLLNYPPANAKVLQVAAGEGKVYFATPSQVNIFPKTVPQPSPPPKRQMTSVTLSPDGTRLASGNHKGDVIIWDTETCQITHHLKCADIPDTPAFVKVHALAFFRGGVLIAAGCSDGKVRVWETDTGKFKKLISAHKKPVTSVAFSPSGKWVASGSDDGTARLTNKDGLTLTLEGSKRLKGYPWIVTAVAFSSPPGTDRERWRGWFAFASADGTLRVYTFPEPASVPPKILQLPDRPISLSFSPSGSTLAVGFEIVKDGVSAGGRLQLWDVSPETKTPAAKALLAPWPSSLQVPDPVNSVSFTPTGDAIAFSHGLDVSVWTPTSSERPASTKITLRL